MKTAIAEHPQKTGSDLYLGASAYTITRNIKILVLLSQDKRPQEIARDLYMAVKTVRAAIDLMKTRNGYQSASGLVSAAIRSKII